MRRLHALPPMLPVCMTCAVLGAFLGGPTPALAQAEAAVTGSEAATTSDALAIPPAPAAGDETMPPPPPMVTTQEASAAEVDVVRLDAWLASFDGMSRTLRYIAAPLGVVAGGLLAGLGVWYITDDSLVVGSREATVGLGAAMIGLGVMSTAMGIYNFIVSTYPEQNYERFQLARGEGLSVRDLGRFEGELRAMAEISRTQRMLSIVAGFSMAVGGGIAVGLSATVDRDDPRTIGMITGSALAIMGVLLGALSFIPTPYEQAWEKYEQGLGPDDTAPTAQVTPLVGPNVAGVSVAGSF
ncbi:MAG: hypothetical protein JRH11_06820 [Deltaproteobacteria bacterium]|nr:hypothetical protein [Deltaproteobacteria bacterium]